MSSEDDGERKPWFEVGEDMFEAAKKHTIILNEAARGDFEDGDMEGFSLVFMADGTTGAMDLPENAPAAQVAAVFTEIAATKNVYGFAVSACIETRRPSKTDHITKQLVLGEMSIDDLRPEDKRKSLVTFLTVKKGDGIWINNFFKKDDKITSQEAILQTTDRVELEPAELIEGDDWMMFYGKSLNFWKL